MNKLITPKNPIRILFLADTHIGYDWPLKPRVRRRRRGDDFYNNYLLALKPAFEKQVDLVIHGGDLLNRSRLPAAVIHRAFEPLLDIADSGIPVYVVPGNHERSMFKLTLLERHERLYVFNKPKVYAYQSKNHKLLLCGFPFVRGDIRAQFSKTMGELSKQLRGKGTVLLCLHHPFDGAKVGPKDFTFYNRPDTINPSDVPAWVDGLFSGHIHRHQVLSIKNGQRRIPVYYPGSIERTSFAEMDEDKGYLIAEINDKGISHKFVQLPARPMYRFDWDVKNYSLEKFKMKLDRLIRNQHPGSILRIKLLNYNKSDLPGKLNRELIRKMTPASMNVDFLM